MNSFPPEQPLHVTLQAKEWNVVMTALFELPAKVSFATIVRLEQQFEAQSAHAGNGVAITEDARC